MFTSKLILLCECAVILRLILKDKKDEAFIRKILKIAHFIVSFSHLHCHIIQHVRVPISGNFVTSAQNCLASTLDYNVMQLKTRMMLIS